MSVGDKRGKYFYNSVQLQENNLAEKLDLSQEGAVLEIQLHSLSILLLLFNWRTNLAEIYITFLCIVNVSLCVGWYSIYTIIMFLECINKYGVQCLEWTNYSAFH